MKQHCVYFLGIACAVFIVGCVSPGNQIASELANQRFVASTIDKTSGFSSFVRGLADLPIQYANLYKDIYRCDRKFENWETYDSTKFQAYDKYKYINIKNIPKSGLVDRSDQTPLMRAARYGCTTAIIFLNKRVGVDPNEQDGIGRSALHLTAMENNSAAMRALLHSNPNYVDVNVKDINGRTPLMWVIYSAYDPDVETEKILALLLKHKDIDVNAVDDAGKTALMYLVTKPEEEISSENEEVSSPEVRIDKYRTMLARFLELALPKLDLNIESKAGFTALDLAEQKNNQWAVSALEEAMNTSAN